MTAIETANAKFDQAISDLDRHRIEVTTNGAGRGTVTLDGIELSRVHSVTFTGTAGLLDEVHISFIAPVHIRSEDAHVTLHNIPPETPTVSP